MVVTKIHKVQYVKFVANQAVEVSAHDASDLCIVTDDGIIYISLACENFCELKEALSK